MCVPPPKSICPSNVVRSTTKYPVNVCGNGIKELNEQCDDGVLNDDDGEFTY